LLTIPTGGHGTHHGEHRPIFSQFEEISFISFILDNFIMQQLTFTNSDLRKVATSVFLHKYDQSEDKPLLSSVQRVLLIRSSRGIDSLRGGSIASGSRP
jgi:hypothetical protein